MPDWDTLRAALQSVLVNQKLDLTAIGTTRRLDFDTFEKVFYHLFVLLDPQETRRKFWDSFPSRDVRERKNFVERAAQLINEKRWSPNRVTTSMLTMCGGAPFRRLLATLIRRTADKEIEQITLKLGPGFDLRLDTIDLKEEHKKLEDELNEKIRKTSEILSSVESIDDQKEQLIGQINDRWEDLARNFLNYDEVPPYDTNQFKIIYKNFLASVGESHSEIKKYTELIRKHIEDDAFRSEIDLDTRDSKFRESKRVSEIILEMQDKLTFTDGKFSSKGGRSSEWLLNKLDQCDLNMKAIYFDCEQAVERAEEALLAKPDFRERYELFKQIVPAVDIKPMFVEQSSEPNLELLEGTLRKYLNPNQYDIEEVIDCSREQYGEPNDQD